MITPAYSLTANERVLPKLALDFTTGTLDSRVDVTRALNTATRVNSSGFIETINANLPRFDYSPVNVGTSQGLLIEELRTNLILQSSSINVTWSLEEILAFGSGSVIDATTSPDGTINADLIVPNTVSSSVHRVLQFIITNTTAHTVSFFAKPAGYSKIGFREGYSTGAYATFNLTTGQVISQGVGGVGSVVNAGNGWYRCSITFTAGAVSRADIFPLPDNYVSGSPLFTYAGDGTSGVYLWGAQVEEGAFATSYIPTTLTSLTRNADVVSMTGTNFSSWYNASNGAFIANFETYISTGVRYILAASTGAIANSFLMSALNAGTDNYILSGGTQQARLFTGTITANTSMKLGLRYANADFAIAANGGGLVTQLSGSLPIGIDRLSIGASAGGGNILNGYMKKVFWYSKLTNAELVAFTK